MDADAIVADLEQLKLVILNLLINSAQAMQGRGMIRASARTTAGGWHELRIIDQGPGISAEAREHLFEPFFTTKHRGTGLGLATARRILEGHRGTIEFECPRPEGDDGDRPPSDVAPGRNQPGLTHGTRIALSTRTRRKPMMTIQKIPGADRLQSARRRGVDPR